MAEYNYSNPAGMAPKINWAPDGFLAGAMYNDQERDYRRATEQAAVLQNLGILKKGAEYQDYMAEGPVRDSRRGLDLATNRALTPIQGRLAAAQGATADATVQTAPSNAQTQVWKNAQQKKMYAEEMVSNALSAALKQGGMQAPMLWRDQIVPQLEQQIGEPIPQQFRNMSLQQMQMLSQSLTQNSETRRNMMMQGQKDDAAMARVREEGKYRTNIAGIRGDVTTAAEVRARAARDLEKAYQTGDTNRILAIEAVYGGNVRGRGAESRETDAARRTAEELRFEKLQRQNIPIPSDPKKRERGKLYRGPRGWGRWTGEGWEMVD